MHKYPSEPREMLADWQIRDKANELFPDISNHDAFEKAGQNYRRELYIKSYKNNDQNKLDELEALAAEQQAKRDAKAKKVLVRREAFDETHKNLTARKRQELIESLNADRDKLIGYLDNQMHRITESGSAASKVSKLFKFTVIKDRLNRKSIETIDFRKELGKIASEAKKHTDRSFGGFIYGLFFNPTSYYALKEVVKKDWSGNWQMRK